jgi:hypothetical protein
MSNKRTDISWSLMRITLFVGFFVNILLALYAWAERSLSIFAVYTLVAWAAGSVGFIAGFLFALPRSMPELTEPAGDGQYGDSKVTNSARQILHAQKFRPNNNLEQISDWLTKLLIGAGLVQLGAVGRGLNGIVGFIATASVGHAGSHPAASARVVAGSVIIFYGVLGFLIGYVSTGVSYRRVLEEYFEDSDEDGNVPPDYPSPGSAERRRRNSRSRWYQRIFAGATTVAFAGLIARRRRSHQEKAELDGRSNR